MKVQKVLVEAPVFFSEVGKLTIGFLDYSGIYFKTLTGVRPRKYVCVNCGKTFYSSELGKLKFCECGFRAKLAPEELAEGAVQTFIDELNEKAERFAKPGIPVVYEKGFLMMAILRCISKNCPFEGETFYEYYNRNRSLISQEYSQVEREFKVKGLRTPTSAFGGLAEGELLRIIEKVESYILLLTSEQAWNLFESLRDELKQKLSAQPKISKLTPPRVNETSHDSGDSLSLKDVKRACDWFDRDSRADQVAYKRAMRVDWRNIHTLNQEELMEEGGVLWFLDRWRAFSHYSLWPDRLDPNLPKAIQVAHRESHVSLRALEGQTIANVDLKDHAILNQIQTIFARFSSIGMRFRHVATSKYLHMVNRELFVMWDGPIGSRYYISNFSALADNPSRAAYEYVNVFLPSTQTRLKMLLDRIASEVSCGIEEAQNILKSSVSDLHKVGKTCAKIIDEFNYARYSRGAI
ncbi:MAG: hypothetical protein QXD82_02255 [Nitrososphaerales archaeon]